MDEPSSQYSFKEALKIYYDRIFPFEEFHQWLSYGSSDLFSRREFSYATNNTYSRHNCYSDLNGFKEHLRKFQPDRIDIGAIYSIPPNQRDTVAKSAVFPVEKELVFDIDMNDYNEVRTCCEGANLCLKCWRLMVICIETLETILKDDFGFKHLLFVFSGRRGVHCWVADSSARKLSENARGKLVDYINVITGGENQVKKVNLSFHLHPTLERIYKKILLPLFESHILLEQEILTKHAESILALVPNPNLVESLKEDWEQNKDENMKERWLNLVRSIDNDMKLEGSRHFYSSNPIYDIIFTFTYPRLDVRVTTGLNHLLKAPFCVHPNTNKICIPIDPAKCKEFDPSTVPTVQQLVHDIDNWKVDEAENENPNSKSLKDYKKTCLAPHIKFFKTKFLQPLQKDLRIQSQQIKQANNSSDLMEF